MQQWRPGRSGGATRHSRAVRPAVRRPCPGLAAPARRSDRADHAGAGTRSTIAASDDHSRPTNMRRAQPRAPHRVSEPLRIGSNRGMLCGSRYGLRALPSTKRATTPKPMSELDCQRRLAPISAMITSAVRRTVASTGDGLGQAELINRRLFDCTGKASRVHPASCEELVTSSKECAMIQQLRAYRGRRLA